MAESTTTLGRRAGRGAAWSALNAFVLRAGQFLMSLVVARLVSPGEFGVFAVALLVYTVIVNVSEVGVGSAIVRELDRTPKIAPTVTTIAVGTSALLTVLMIVAAPYLCAALGAPDATNAVRVLASTMVIGSLGTVPAAILQRDYRQKARFGGDAGFFVASNVVLVALALGGGGVMALAVSRVVGQVASTLIFVVASSERYRPGFDRAEARRLLAFGLPLAGANLLNFTVSNVDAMIIGRTRGPLSLGYYSLAFNVSGWPVSVFSSVLNSVGLATFARVKDAPAQLRGHARTTLGALGLAAFPVSALTVALATPLVTAVYGARWAPAGSALAALAVFGSVRVVIALLSDLLVAVGVTWWLLRLQGVWLIVLIPAMIVGVDRAGITGAGIAHTAVALLVVVPAYAVAVRRRTPLRMPELGRAVLVPLVGAVVCGIAAALTADAVDGAWWKCVAGTAVGLVAYAAVVGRWAAALVRELRVVYAEPVTAEPVTAEPVTAEPVTAGPAVTVAAVAVIDGSDPLTAAGLYVGRHAAAPVEAGARP